LAATVAASATVALDATIANVALPDMGEDLGAGVAELQWVITGYMLTLASFILLGGALGDRYGRRHVFTIGAVWFALASLACGLAPSVPVLVGARMLQGIGGALLAPTSLAILQAGFVSDDRGRAVGAWSGLGGLAAAAGPLIGGVVVDQAGWRWAFLLSVPLAAVSVVAVRVVPETREHDASSHFDVGGAVLAVVALAGLTWVLTEAPQRGLEPSIVVAAAVALAAAVSFVVRERRVTAPLVPGLLFRSRCFTVLNIATFTLYGAISAQFFLLVLQLQNSAGWSALEAGSALLPVTVLMFVGSARSGELAIRHGPRLQLIVGPLLVAVALVLLARIDSDAEWLTDVLPGAVIYGFGLVCFVAPLTASVMGSVDDDHVSTASGVNNAVARTGGLFAVAVLPGLAGLTTAVGIDELTDAYRIGMWMAAVLALFASVVVAVGLPRPTETVATPRRFQCAVDGAPLQPDPEAVVST
jgi:EmrB/QacA subfamily drug resistance transporter